VAFLALVLFAATQSSLPRFREEVVDRESGGSGFNSCLMDVRGSGRPDIILVTQKKDQVIRYANPAWKKQILATDGVILPEPLVAFDVDGDGKPELFVGGNFQLQNTTDPCPLFLLRPGADPDQPWVTIKLDEEPSLHRLAPLTLSGKKELVVSCLMGKGSKAPDWAGPGAALYLLRPTSDPFRDPWKRELISNELHRVHGITAVDWDGQGRQDLLFVAAFEGIHVYRKGPERWEVAEVIGKSPGASEIKVFRLPGGKRALAAIEPWHGDQLVIYVGGPGSWERRVIHTGYRVGHGIVPVDFAGSGVDSLVVGFRGVKGEGGHAVVILHPKDGSGSNWETKVVDAQDMEADAIHAFDLNGDGRIDLVATGKGTNVKIYWNEGN
jgi:hypothetical protein